MYHLTRSPKGSFGSAYVFPGGNLHPSDHDPAWLDFAKNENNRIDYHMNSEMFDFSPYLIAAFRETFEEGGIFLSSKAILKEKLDFWRNMIRKTPEKLLEIIKSESSGRLEMNRLKYIAEWITPPKYPKRFATKFFLCVQNPSETFESKEDGQEIVGLEWVDPVSFLAVYSKEPGKYILFPPQYHILSTFANEFPSFQSILRWQVLLPDPYAFLKKVPVNEETQSVHLSTTTPWVTPFLPLKITEDIFDNHKVESFKLPGDSSKQPHQFTTYIDSKVPGALSIKNITLKSKFNTLNFPGSINPFSIPNEASPSL
ncbi:Nucleoside diphosphate-linked moiety X motif 19, mitochondrial, variant 2 [Entomophthora muscae]|uniref:Nucleoside diphosphate-linked moiety X motif 19, mitochondrial, variant 2 n=1 Tax=Entomophthora muscae TaxID=34485 RepID=A0ACC2SXV1_9FUNG|nr:Nucleoside diphosphate-linked moiety X motif 19, mitochondrial, variant 2 [Entomophthora muscae]